MRFAWLMPGLLVSVLFLAACAAPDLRDDNLLRDTTVLAGDESCAAPCWRGIVPGETDWQDAVTIVEDEVEFTNLSVEQVGDGSAALQAIWQQGEDGALCCQMFSTEDGETVNVVFLRLAPRMTMDDLVEVWGDPSFVRGVEFTDDQAIMNLIYPDVPMVIYAFVEGPAEGAVSEDSELIGILYMSERDMELLLTTNDLHEWDGYGTFASYEDGEFEVTPSVTLTPTPADE